ncbi:MAG: electron transfer flavoprotein subunit beta/FixA family protein [Bryobacteraceae bacterium]|nr:electron transfer flavoprotein subunit beta/FixA family protein [Bryobacteraceae bacterium]
MKILVAVKQVPARDLPVEPAPSGLWIAEAGLSYEMNEPDAYALEAALRLKESGGGEVVAVSAGPERVQSVLREALAKGADRAIHVAAEGEAALGLDPVAAAALLEAAVREEQPDLVLTGLQSDDTGTGQTGVVLAARLGWPHATLVVAIEPGQGAVRARRELEGGWFQHVTLPLPAVLTVQSGIARLRYATLMGIKRAKTKEIRRLEVALEGIRGGLRLAGLAQPRRVRQTQFLEGSAAEQASKLVEKLRFEARVL